MFKHMLLWGIVAILVFSLACGAWAMKPDRVIEMQAAKTYSAEKLLVEGLKAEVQIETTLETSIQEIKNALTLNEMLERAHHNDRKIARIVARFERYYGPLDSSPYYIEVYNTYVGASVWIDPIHICGQGEGY